MATISIDTGDAATTQRVVDALCAVNGYQANIPDPANPGQTIPNPQTKAQFAKAQVVAFIKATVHGYERSQAAVPAPPNVT